ncbi:MAG TPA: condensation domain-containing protein, partial [Thermoanaerobaculia bacterium]
IKSRIADVFGVDLPLATLFAEPTPAGVARQIEALRGGAPTVPLAPVDRPPLAAPLPLSFSQERLWVLDRFEPGSPAFNIPLALRLRGALSLPALSRALDFLVARHESLRTTFELATGGAVQRIAERLELPLPTVDLSHLPEAEREATVAARRDAVAATSFDLLRGPLLRLELLRLGEDEHALLLAIHHIITDGWSMGVFVRELATAYAAYDSGGAPELPELPIQYGDVAAWQRQELSGDRLAQRLAYWRERLAGAPPALELPTDRPRPAIRNYHGASRSLRIDAALVAELRALGRGLGATLFMTLLSAFSLLLGRLSGQDDVPIGTPTASRSRSEIEGLIGMFLNTLVLRTDLAGDPTFAELVRRVREVALGAYDHQDLPFEKLLDELKPPRDLSRTPLFQVFFNMLNLPPTAIELPGLAISTLTAPEVPAKFDLTVYVAEETESGGLRFDLNYNAGLFAAARIEELLRQYAGVLRQVVAEPARPISQVSLLTEAARQVLPDPREKLSPAWVGAVHERFAELAAREPGRLAVSDCAERLTYGELDRAANRLANRLRGAGLATGDVVAIYGHRSARLVQAVMAVLKAGGAFTILDPAHPPARLVDCLRLAAPRAWIEIGAAGPPAAAVSDFVTTLRCAVRVVLTPPGVEPVGADPVSGESDADPRVAIGPDDVALVTFTSGSTGIPKGVQGRHGPLSHFIPWQCEAFALGPDDRFSMLSGLAHDPLQRDMFTPLQIGGAVSVPDPMDIATPGRLAEWMRQQRITVAHLTPAMGQVLTEAAPGGTTAPIDSLRRAFFVGDVLTRRDVDRLRERAPNVRVINLYGSTETQRAVGHYPVPDSATTAAAGARQKESQPLGKGVVDVQVLIVGRSGDVAGIGEL